MVETESIFAGMQRRRDRMFQYRQYGAGVETERLSVFEWYEVLRIIDALHLHKKATNRARWRLVNELPFIRFSNQE